jgi:hypothetical protein
MSKEKKLSKKQAALYGQELGKIGRAAERGGAVNYVQEKMNDFSQRQMAYNKVKNEPIRQKLAGIGIGLTVAAATNPELGRGVQRMFTGNPVHNVQDALTRQRMIRQNMKSAKIVGEDLKNEARSRMAAPPSHPSLPNSVRSRQEHYANKLAQYEKQFSKENIYKRSVQMANEDITLVQTNRILNKAIDKQVAEAVKKLQR